MHCTQVLRTGSQRGVVPPQSLSTRQPTQICGDFKHKGVAGKAAPGVDINVDMKDFSKIPLRYADFTTSELTVDVKRGETLYDIELKE